MQIYVLDLAALVAAIFLAPLIFTAVADVTFTKVMDRWTMLPFRGYEGSPVLPEIFTTVVENDVLRMSTSVPNLVVTHGSGVSMLTMSVLQMYLRGRSDLSTLMHSPYASRVGDETRDLVLDPSWLREHHYVLSFRLPFQTQIRAMAQGFLTPGAHASEIAQAASSTSATAQRSAGIVSAVLPYHFAFISERFEVILFDSSLAFKWAGQAPSAAAVAQMITGHHVAVVPTAVQARRETGLVVAGAIAHSEDGERTHVFVGYSGGSGEVLWQSEVPLRDISINEYQADPLPRKVERQVKKPTGHANADHSADETSTTTTILDSGDQNASEAAMANRPFLFERDGALARFAASEAYRHHSPAHADSHYFLPLSIQERARAAASFGAADAAAVAASPDTVAYISDDHITLLDSFSGAELTTITKNRASTIAPGPAAKTGVRVLYRAVADTVAGSVSWAVAVDYDEATGLGAVAWRTPLRPSALGGTALTGLDDAVDALGPSDSLPSPDPEAIPPILSWRAALPLPDAVFISHDGWVHTLRADGRVRWAAKLPRWDSEDNRVSQPRMSLQRVAEGPHGLVLLVETGDRLVLLNPDDGALVLQAPYAFPNSISRARERQEAEKIGLGERPETAEGSNAAEDYSPDRVGQRYHEDNSKGRSVFFGDILSPLPGAQPRTMFVRSGNTVDAYQPNLGQAVSGIQRVLRLVSIALLAACMSIGFRRLPREGRKNID